MTYEPLDSLENQTAVITGVMGGIGWATAERLSRRGAKIVGIVRRDLDAAQAQLDTLGQGHLAVLADVTNQEELYSTLNKIKSCDILVNAAGSTKYIAHYNFSVLTDEVFDSMLTNNLRSVYTVTKTFLPLLKNSKNGLVINIGSTAGSHWGGSNLAYACAKAGIDSLTKNLSKAIAPVRIISINPGVVDTDFIEDRPDNYYELCVNLTPLKRIAVPDDIAAAIEGYATLLRFTTGISVTVDGGRAI